MKVLIIQGTSATGFPSGELVVISNEQSELAKIHDVRVEVIHPRSASEASLMSRGMDLFWSRSNYQRVGLLIDEFQPDLVHFHTISPYLSLSVLVAAKIRGVPVIQTLHNMRWLCVEGGFYRSGQYCNECVKSNGWRGVVNGCSRGRSASLGLFLVNILFRCTERLFSLVDKFIAVSDFVREQHLKSGFPAEKIEVNNNGIPLNSIQNRDFEKPWKIRRGVAFAGRVSTAKGAAVLQHLMTKIDQPIHIIGDGPEKVSLQQFRQQNHFAHVKFWGNISHQQTLDLLGSVVCSIVPSQCGETFSLVAAESMALGTPVVASNIGGLAGLIEQSGGGILFEPKDFEGAVEAVTRLLGSLSEAEKIGVIGREYVLEHLSLKQSTEKLQKIYDSVV